MKNFPKNFDPIFGVAVVKLRLRLRSSRRPQGGVCAVLSSKVARQLKIQLWVLEVLQYFN